MSLRRDAVSDGPSASSLGSTRDRGRVSWLASILGAGLLTVLTHPIERAEAASDSVIAMCWARPGALECAASKKEEQATQYCASQCRYWASSAKDKAQCKEVWRCTKPGWAGIIRPSVSSTITSSVCGEASESAVRKLLKEKCPSGCLMNTYQIAGAAGADSSMSPGVRLWMAAQKYESVPYGPKGDSGAKMQCSDLIIAAAKDAGLTVKLPTEGRATTYWFNNGLGPDFTQVGPKDGITLDALAKQLGETTFSLKIGTVLVEAGTGDDPGHAALFSGIMKTKGGDGEQWRIVTYDANASVGWDVAVTGAAVQVTDGNKAQFPGKAVGTHISRLQWNGKVKLFEPK